MTLGKALSADCTLPDLTALRLAYSYLLLIKLGYQYCCELTAVMHLDARG